VDGHDAHDVVLLAERSRRAEIAALLAQPVDHPEEAEQAAERSRFILPRAVEQRLQVRLPLQAAG